MKCFVPVPTHTVTTTGVGFYFSGIAPGTAFLAGLRRKLFSQSPGKEKSIR